MRTISDELKIYELSKLWKEAEYNFAFWDKLDLDWDAEYKKALPRVLAANDVYAYYRELMRFAALLGDGHTDVFFPDDVRRDATYFSAFPIKLSKFGSDIVLTRVSEAHREEVPLYSVLKKINTADTAAYIKENCYPYIWHTNEDACGARAIQQLLFGRKGSRAVFTFESGGKAYRVPLTREDPADIKWCADALPRPDVRGRLIVQGDTFKCVLTDDDIAIFKVTAFDDRSMPEKVYAHFDTFRKASAFIIDVRGNTGGDSENANALAALFIDGDFACCGAETQIYEPTFKAWGVFRDDLRHITPAELKEKYTDEESVKIYQMSRHIFYKRTLFRSENRAPGRLDGPVAVLTDAYTFSAGEDFADVMKAHTNAVFVGTNTAGSSGQPLLTKLESGGWFRICTRRCFAQNGEDIYNKGFSPDIRVVRSLRDHMDGRDSALEKALLLFRQR